LKLSQLECAQEVANNGLSITTATRNLYKSQSAISTSISNLEKYLGVKIFKRKGKKLVSVTPAGEAILSNISTILNEVKKIKIAAKSASLNPIPKWCE